MKKILIIDDDLELYLPMATTTGATTTIYDRSRNGYDGTVNGTTTCSASGGKQGDGCTFDGSSSYVSVGPISLDANEGITVSAWVHSSNFDQNGFIVGENPVNTRWQLYFNSTFLRWKGGADASTIKCSLPSNNQWHHVVAQ